MDLKRMEVFCKIVELKNFTRAGEALSLAQPTVSEHIRALEVMLGEKLLDRFKGEILPTPVGQVFYQYAKNIIQMRDEAFQAVEQFRGKMEGQLNLAASTIPGTYILPKLIGEFKAAHPGGQIALHISDTIGTAEAVAAGRVDLGMVGATWAHPKLTFEEVGSDKLVLTVSPNHVWAQAGIIELLDLAQEPFLLREPGSGTRMVIKQILENHGLNIRSLNVVAEMGSTDSVKQGVKDGIGVSILSALAVSDELSVGNLVSVEIRGISFERPFYLIMRKNKKSSPLCLAFIVHLKRLQSELCG